MAVLACYLLAALATLGAILLVADTALDPAPSAWAPAFAVLVALILLLVALAAHLGARALRRERDPRRAQGLGLLTSLLAGLGVVRAIEWGQFTDPAILVYLLVLGTGLAILAPLHRRAARDWLTRASHQ